MRRLANSNHSLAVEELRQFSGDLLASDKDPYIVLCSRLRSAMRAAATVRSMAYILGLCDDVDRGHLSDERAREILQLRALEHRTSETSNHNADRMHALQHEAILHFLAVLPSGE